MLDEEGEEADGADKRSEIKKDTSHAPDLLDGPSINQTSRLWGQRSN